MKRLADVPISVLDLAPIVEGDTARRRFRNARATWPARRALGLHALLAGRAPQHPGHRQRRDGGRDRARRRRHLDESASVPAAIMLPNHAPLVIAEQFGTLASLYPGRIDLGLGRAPGGDQIDRRRALRRGRGAAATPSRRTWSSCSRYFRRSTPGQAVQAVPGEGLDVPIWLLGSSDFSARLAAELGLPFAFASHFAPDYLLAGARRSTARTSGRLRVARRAPMRWSASTSSRPRPTRRPGASSPRCSRLPQLASGARPRPLPPPVDSMDGRWSPAEEAEVGPHAARSPSSAPPSRSGTGSRPSSTATGVDELMVTGADLRPRGPAPVVRDRRGRRRETRRPPASRRQMTDQNRRRRYVGVPYTVALRLATVWPIIPASPFRLLYVWGT